MTPPAVIVGTGRSGSGYIAQVLNRAGIRCGHESYWNPHDDHKPGLHVDSSWCALALGLDDYDGHVFHQARHPLDVVSSFVKNPPHDEYRALKVKLMPYEPIDPVEFGMLAWFTYIEAAEHRAERMWRLEDVNADLVVDLGAAVGVNVTRKRAEKAVAKVPRNYNWHGKGRRLSWPELPAGWLRDQLLAWANRWGWE